MRKGNALADSLVQFRLTSNNKSCDVICLFLNLPNDFLFRNPLKYEKPPAFFLKYQRVSAWRVTTL